MTISAVKSNFHHLIDEIDDIDLLAHLYEAIYLLKNHPAKQDILDELSASQKNDLEIALLQVKNGQTISDEEMKIKSRVE